MFSIPLRIQDNVESIATKPRRRAFCLSRGTMRINPGRNKFRDWVQFGAKACGYGPREEGGDSSMLFRAIFWIGLVSLLMPHEPDLGFGRPHLGAAFPS